MFCPHLCLYTTCMPDAHREQKRVSNPLEVDWQAVINCPQRVLGTKPWSSERAARTLNHQTTCLSTRSHSLGQLHCDGDFSYPQVTFVFIFTLGICYGKYNASISDIFWFINCVCMSVCHMCVGIRRSHRYQISERSSYRQLWGVRLYSSARVIQNLNHWVVPPVLLKLWQMGRV